MNEDDIALLRRYAEERSEAAFAEIVRRHVSLVYHAALRQTGGDATLAEDATQAVFADLAQKAGTLLGRPVLTGWLYTSTRFAAMNARRTERRRQAREQEAHLMHELTHETTPAADWERLRPVIDDALHTLDERDREAVLLRFFEGRAFAEVGRDLRLSEEAARKRVERALEKMQTALAQRGVKSTAAALGIALAGQAAVAAPAGLAASVTVAALAGASAAGTGGIAAAVSFMTITKITTGLAALVVLGVVGSGGFEVGQAREPKAAVALAPRAAESESRRPRSEDLVVRGRDAEDIAREVTVRDRELERTNAWLKGVQAQPVPVAKENPKVAETAPWAAEKPVTRSEFSLSGMVKHPGKYAIGPDRSVSLSAAVAQAGGLVEDRANAKKVRVSRRQSDGTTKIFVVDLETTEGFVVEAGDLIYVPEKIIQ